MAMANRLHAIAVLMKWLAAVYTVIQTARLNDLDPRGVSSQPEGHLVAVKPKMVNRYISCLPLPDLKKGLRDQKKDLVPDPLSPELISRSCYGPRAG
jgi:hypothetical protein